MRRPHRSRVLNAFRHQRTIHSPGFRVSFPSTHVLNAFRHQRTIHSAAYPATRLAGAMCSTPFGINERFTRRSEIARHAAFVRVLNAFRHQRTIHDSPAVCGAAPLSGAQRLSASTNDSLELVVTCLRTCQCSTPFGINERFTTASSGMRTQVTLVLNAFRHQRTIHLG